MFENTFIARNYDDPNWLYALVRAWRYNAWVLTGLATSILIGAGVVYSAPALVVLGSIFAGLQFVRYSGAAFLRFRFRQSSKAQERLNPNFIYLQRENEQALNRFSALMSLGFLRWLVRFHSWYQDTVSLESHARAIETQHGSWLYPTFIAQPFYWLSILGITIAAIILTYQVSITLGAALLAVTLLNITSTVVPHLFARLAEKFFPDNFIVKQNARNILLGLVFGLDLLILAIVTPIAFQPLLFAVGGGLTTLALFSYAAWAVSARIGERAALPRWRKVTFTVLQFLVSPESLIIAVSLGLWASGLLAPLYLFGIVGVAAGNRFKRLLFDNVAQKLYQKFHIGQFQGTVFRGDQRFMVANRQMPNFIWQLFTVLEPLYLTGMVVGGLAFLLPGVVPLTAATGLFLLTVSAAVFGTTLLLPRAFMFKRSVLDKNYKPIKLTRTTILGQFEELLFADAAMQVAYFPGEVADNMGKVKNIQVDQFGHTYADVCFSKMLQSQNYQKTSPLNRQPYSSKQPKVITNKVLMRQAARYQRLQDSVHKLAMQYIQRYRKQGVEEKDLLQKLEQDGYKILIEAKVIVPDEDFPKDSSGRLIFETGALVVDQKSGETRPGRLFDESSGWSSKKADPKLADGQTFMYRSLAVEAQIKAYQKLSPTSQKPKNPAPGYKKVLASGNKPQETKSTAKPGENLISNIIRSLYKG